ncbi:MAG: cation diffusion facilitator family transporter [Alphaproteobacteria bacterium]
MDAKKSALIRIATYASVMVATILVVAKFVAWQATHSLSLQASFVDSVLDVFASLINFYAVRHALRPADKEHRFGHGKAESLAGLAQSGFFAISALWLIKESFHRFLNPQAIQEHTLGISVIIFSIVITAILIAFQAYVIKRTRSLIISADSLHYRADLLTGLAVLISLTVSTYYNLPFFDIAVGLCIAIYILQSSWSIGRQAVNVLMDRELSDEARAQILSIAINHPHVLGVHDLRTRSAGLQDFIQMHLDLSAELSFHDAHDVSLQVSQVISHKFPHCEILIHIDPVEAS